MSPAHALEGPFSRSLCEALESVASAAVVPRLIESALTAAGRGAVPEDAGPFAAFVEGPLREVIVQALGPSAYELVAERLSHVLAMASSQVRAKEPAGAQPDESACERDERSRVRLAAGALRSEPAPLEERTPARSEPGTSQALGRVVPVARTRGAIEHDARPLGSPRTDDTVRPPRRAPVRVLIATLDPLLITETEARLAGRSAVFGVGTTVELSAQIAFAGGRVAVVIDTVLPSIDVPSFAALASTFPPGTPVVLWGMSERQKQRLVAMFPGAAGWIASGATESPADLLATD